MTKIHVALEVVEKNELIDREPVIVAPGDSYNINIDETKENIFLRIFCKPSLEGIGVYHFHIHSQNDKI